MRHFVATLVIRRPAVLVHADDTGAILLTRMHLRYLIAQTILTESGCLAQMYISASTSSLHTRPVPWPGVIPRYTEIYNAEG